MLNFHFRLLLLTLCFVSNFSIASNNPSGITWRNHDASAFKDAAKKNKLIILNLEAVWCHWCHVMDAKTYANPNVVALIEKSFIALKADHDERPDLAERYREWGWPATIILTAQGDELVKRAGYISPEDMVVLLNRVLDSPQPSDKAVLGERFSDSPLLDTNVRKRLKKRHIDSYDKKRGGLLLAQKFLDQDSIEWDLLLSKQGDKVAEQRVQQTLDAAKKLIDPEFGGAYQYSTGSSWNNPHFEKIMKTQARYLILYSKACTQFEMPSYCQTAKQVGSYLINFLSDENGGFYTSQDADLIQGTKGHEYFSLSRKERLIKGIPRIDKHQYAGENGQAIEGMVYLYLATSQKKWLDRAIQAADWVWGNRRYADGGFKHDAVDMAGPYLSDTLFMGRAFVALYRSTKDKKYLIRAVQAALFIDRNFRHKEAGLVSAADNGTPVKPLPQVDQNIQAMHFYLDIYDISKNAAILKPASHISRYLVSPKIALKRLTEVGVLHIDHRSRAIW